MSEADTIICGRHGETRATFMCQHLASGVACGYHADEDPADTWPDAWCDVCAEILDVAGEWTDEASRLANIKALCTHCYEQARARNRAVPQFARGLAARLTDEETSQLIHHAVHEAQALQAVSRSTWGWGDMARWDYDDEANTVTFSDQARPTVIADTQFVGSYAPRPGTFQWAWQTLGADDPNHRAISQLRMFGQVRGISKLTTATWACDLADGWAMASLAGYLLGSEGLYRAPFRDGQQLWFMLLSNWRALN